VARLQTAIKKALDGATDAGLILVEPTRPRVADGDKAA